MAEYPEDICRLVNQYVPWDRHHRSPVAEIVKSRLFTNASIFFLNRWRRRYEISGAVHHGMPELRRQPSWTWDTLPEILSPEEEAIALRDMEEHMLDHPEDMDEEETETEEDEEEEENDGGDARLAMFEESD